MTLLAEGTDTCGDSVLILAIVISVDVPAGRQIGLLATATETVKTANLH
jgi:hypothetical protein